MGITISNHKKSIDMGYGGYLNLRLTISKLVHPDFAAIYGEIGEFRMWARKGFKSEQEYWDDYEARALKVCEDNKLDEEVVNFLYRSDCAYESVSVKTCRHLWKIIKDYDDDVLYGYCGRPDCAKFADFKEIVRTCAQDRRVMRFS